MLVRLLLGLGVAVAVVAVAVWLLRPGHTPADTGPAGIAVLEPVSIGGMDQWVLIRGQDRGNPILLWLHGGPGAAQMPLAHATTRALEGQFTVVHWDQRGAGRSNPVGFDPATMTLDRFEADVHELTAHLKFRLGVERVVLLGHSWGAQLGASVVARRPQDYMAYISVAQVVSPHDADRMALEWLREQAAQVGHASDMASLSGLEATDLNDHGVFVRTRQMLERYGGGMNVSGLSLLWMALRAPEYAGSDYWRLLDGMQRGSGPMWEASRRWNAFSDAGRIEVPVFLMAGRHDMNTPFELIAAYSEALEAPAGKELIAFEASGHAPFLTEPQRFVSEMLRIAATVEQDFK